MSFKAPILLTMLPKATSLKCSNEISSILSSWPL